jgi:aspartyl-tRNA(Asn)/glutamyl-tRNA(Gln) amidotransferase subunit C
MTEPKITPEEVRHVAHLARLSLDDDEVRAMSAELDAILRYMAELDAIDVASIEPTYHSVPMNAPLRRDRVERSLDREEVLDQAPATEAGGIAVPRVLEVDE